MPKQVSLDQLQYNLDKSVHNLSSDYTTHKR